MKSTYLKAPALCITMLLTGSVFAQNRSGNFPEPFSPASSFRTWSVGLNAGALIPIAPFGKNDFTNWETDFGYGAYIKKQLSHSFSLQANFLRGNLTANNDNKLGNGTAFSSPFDSYETEIKAAGSLTANFSLGQFYWLHKKSFLKPYVTVGAGLMQYSTQLTRKVGGTVDYTPDASITEVYFPVGAGLKIGLSRTINLDLAYTMNFVDADNLDGYHYGPQNDKFSYGSVGLEFALGSMSKPQLANYNPAAALQYDFLKLNEDLENQLASERAKNEAQRQQMATDWARFKSDEDKDGVSDFFDKCPGTPAGAQVDGGGCPLQVTVNNPVKVIVTEEDRRVVADAIKNLEFDLGKSTIRPTSYPTLNKVAALLTQKNFSLKLAGHTDNTGSMALNLSLSKDRAESVKAYLVSQGANPTRIEATGYGPNQPIATNATAEGRQQNRRVEFTLY